MCPFRRCAVASQKKKKKDSLSPKTLILTAQIITRRLCAAVLLSHGTVVVKLRAISATRVL